jgi:4-amino-4-deoxy-L-arabinose transferase-like glycosyltransferase
VRDWYAQWKPRLRKHKIGQLLSENYPLFAILIGVLLISIPMGPYRNADTQLEFSAVQGVLKWGYPYLEVKGNLFDLPPLGFYTGALFFIAFGAAMDNVVALITLFGLASTVVVYELGKEAYGKSTGLFAAAFFALAPWQLILTRAFLVDAQCLFLSLVYLYFGNLAIRKDSVKLALVSGIFFAAALLTKQYAVFMLIPLLLLYIYHRPKKPKQILLQLGAFILPALHATIVWYQLIMGKWLFYFVQHSDFADLNFPGVVPSYSFITTFLIDYGLGVFFLAAIIFSLTTGMLFWRHNEKWVLFDLVSLVTILFIIGVNLYLGVTLNLKAPYTSAIKYSYQSLPFFSLAAASLASKSASLLKSSTRNPGKLKSLLLFSIGLMGLFFLVTPMLDNMNTAHQLTRLPHLIFRVQPDIDAGYSFVAFLSTSQNNILPVAQLIGFMVLLSGLLWASRPFILDLWMQL